MSVGWGFECGDYSYCNNISPSYNEFICKCLCEEMHERTIQVGSQSQYYSSISDQQAADLYEAMNLYLSNNESFQFPDLSLDDDWCGKKVIKETECWSEGGECSNDWTNYKNGWGALIDNGSESINSVAIHINHPLHDENSDIIGGYLFESDFLNPRWLSIAGAHRYSFVDSAIVPNCPDSSEDTLNYGADVARYMSDCDASYLYTTPFQVYHEALSDNIENLFSISVHGHKQDALNMEDSLLEVYETPPSFILTNGNSTNGNDCIPPDSITSTIFHYLNDYFSGNGFYNEVDSNIIDIYDEKCDTENIAVIVQQEINCEDQQRMSCSDADSPFETLGGYHNTQGRYTNGYYNDAVNTGNLEINNDNDIWLQIEINDCIRDTTDTGIRLYNETALIISTAIKDCKIEGVCHTCSADTPCSNPMGNGVDYNCYDFECNDLDCNTGDINGDGGWNVLDVVTLANCVLANNCGDLEYGCAGDMNGDGGWNVLDVVTLANCVLANNCGE